ncbi:uncharacterized protein LOC116120166 [Pistacia vera]|uniref:uncharacterized protein LOC116120166 n=1 Tax=Pistacia vera TaxID=55513 RepID=UPI001263C921|nr:uncharacterized protein LOC116120166 [Pistacia vera]XP_031261966.1 uncharacterized protein LOC116120166 [Pistacia vera]
MTTHNQDQALPPPKKSQRKRRCLIAIGAIILLIFLLFVVVLILALTVFKTKQPKTQLQSAKVEGIAPRVTLPTLNFQLNLTLDLQILVENPNHASFRHGTGNSILVYRGDQVGEADIYPGLIPSDGSTTLPCRLTVQVDKFASDITTLIGDIMGGQVVMETHTKIPGRINFLGIFKKHVVTSSDCKFTIGFPAMNITNQECKNKL